MTYFGFIPGYALFWGVFAVALGLFSYRIRQLLQYMFLGQKETGYKSWGKWITTTFAYVFSQLCQLKNFRSKDRAPLGHALMVWGFFVSVLFYFFFYYSGRRFGPCRSGKYQLLLLLYLGDGFHGGLRHYRCRLGHYPALHRQTGPP